MNRYSFVPTLPRLFPAAEDAIRAAMVSHRSVEFETLVRQTENHLRVLCGDESFLVILVSGPGTFANELMIRNFCSGHRSLVLCNGEFGYRLASACPECIALDFGFARHWEEERILELLDSKPEIDRIIGVCCETSSGMVNDIAMLNRICEARGIWFALDAVSALGVESGFCSCPALAMATGSSGKALAGVPGIAILLLNPRFPRSVSEVQPKILQLEPLLSAREMPGMVRNTMSSLLLAALEASCRSILELGQDHYRRRLLALKDVVRLCLADFGVKALAGSDSPIVTAFHRPEPEVWRSWLRSLDEKGVEIYHRVCYLEQRNLFEIAAMGDWQEEFHRIPDLLQL